MIKPELLVSYEKLSDDDYIISIKFQTLFGLATKENFERFLKTKNYTELLLSVLGKEFLVFVLEVDYKDFDNETITARVIGHVLN